MDISKYQQSDSEEIRQLFINVFSDSEGQEEGDVIGGLVVDLMLNTDEQDMYGFIATKSNQIIGSIFFTRLVFEHSVNAFILSPVAIHTEYQGQGVGQSLINFGIKYLQETGVELVFTYGDPAFYTKVGFKCITEATAKAPFELSQPEGWLGQSLIDGEIQTIAGKSRCVGALSKPEYW